MKRENIKQAAEWNERLEWTEKVIEALKAAQDEALGEGVLTLRVPLAPNNYLELAEIQHHESEDEHFEHSDLFACLEKHFAGRKLTLENDIEELE